MYNALVAQGYKDLPKLPPKKFMMSENDKIARQNGLQNLIVYLTERKETLNSTPFVQFVGLDKFFREVMFSEPRLIMNKRLEKKEQVTACVFIEQWNIFVLGVQGVKGSRLEVYAFQKEYVSFAQR